jgi:hypothetical protein
MRVRYVKKAEGYDNKDFTIGEIYEVDIVDSSGDYWVKLKDGIRKCLFKREVELIEEQPTDQHYNNTNGSLYKFAQDHELNAWEFDIIKRITRCRKKGQFKEDLEKTKRVIDLYLKEFEA